MSLKIAQFSDSHEEFYYDNSVFFNELKETIKKVNPDVLTIAGDAAKASRLPLFLEKILPNPDEAKVPYVIFVTGNHEYYNEGKSIDEVNKEIHQWVSDNSPNEQGRHFIFLDNSSYVLKKDGVSYRFSGGTLWTDMNIFNDQVVAKTYAERALNDYRYIIGKDNKKRLTVEETIGRHNETMSFLKSVMSNSKNKADVDIFITHHQPTLETCVDFFKKDPYTPCFASNLDDFIKDNDIAIWMAGHSHGAKSVSLNGTFISNNTIGYPGEQLNTSVRLICLENDKSFTITSEAI